MSNKRNRLSPLPTVWDSMRVDPMLHTDPKTREVELRNMQNWRRKYVLPIIRLLTLLSIVLIRVVKRISPVSLHFPNAYSLLSIWYLRRIASPDAVWLVLRHFHVEANLINFVAKNCGADDVEEVDLKPTSPEGVGNVNGVNATLLHDANMFNVIIDLGTSTTANVSDAIPVEEIDFSSLEFSDEQFAIDPKMRFFNLDFESSIYMIVRAMTLLLDEDSMESAANSLQLDESLLHVISNLTGDSMYRNWTPLKFSNYITWPWDAGRSLHLHMLVTEYAHTRLCRMRDSRKQQPATL